MEITLGGTGNLARGIATGTGTGAVAALASDDGGAKDAVGRHGGHGLAALG